MVWEAKLRNAERRRKDELKGIPIRQTLLSFWRKQTAAVIVADGSGKNDDVLFGMLRAKAFANVWH